MQPSNWTEDDHPTPDQERETWAREECARRGINPDEICADGGVEAWMVVAKEPVSADEALPDFSDEDIYEAIEELQTAALMAEQEPMEALFSDTALLVRFLMRERDQSKSEQYNLSMEVVRLDLALEDNKQASKEEVERITEQMSEWRSVARRWYALDGGSWHVERHAAEKADLLEDTRALIDKAGAA